LIIKTIKSFDNFITEGKSSKDYWWDRNYDKLIDVATEFTFEDWWAYLGNEKDASSMLEQTEKNKALYLFHKFDEDELSTI
jgi:hypothetical protein